MNATRVPRVNQEHHEKFFKNKVFQDGEKLSAHAVTAVLLNFGIWWKTISKLANSVRLPRYCEGYRPSVAILSVSITRQAGIELFDA
jgi:hypothetical protein